MVSEGTFRLDLYYRINVVTIKAPSLADHLEDVPVLAQFLIRQYADLYNKRLTGLAPGALALLQAYDWPGNVRELENALQTAIIRADTDVIQAEDLPETLQEEDAFEASDVPQVGSFERLLRDFKVKLATKAIEDCKGNKTLAARSLNISRAYLHRLIRLPEDIGASDAA
jgi:transcriptional regulator with PAS, ATPase and Fis domain